MSVSAVGSHHPHGYLQSLLGSASTGASGSPTSFLSPSASDDSAAGTMTGATTSPKPGSSPFDPGTLAALISMQGEQTGSAADPSSLFGQLDSNGDGSVSQRELTIAQQSRAHHGHHGHHAHGSGDQSGGAGHLLNTLMASIQDASSETMSNSDDSSTTTITYADGSKVAMTSPAASGRGASGANGAHNTAANVMEQLIQLQAQLTTPASHSTIASV